MTKIYDIAIRAIDAYIDQFNLTAELDPADYITRDDIDYRATALDHHNLAFRIDITNDDCAISILALDIDKTTDRFATDDHDYRFFLSADDMPYIPLP